ncbi:DUF2975 domain-containing protein [Ideonella sp. YS5]|uniref:DUF2975 domain-containing protein n=1 Tax=Ideonella sp. YS5 TaxID=3453714 RepID=UPI003EE8E577
MSLSPLPSAALAQRLRRLARLVRGLCVLAAVVLGAWPVLLLFAPDSLVAVGAGQAPGIDMRSLLQGEFTFATRIRVALVSLLPCGLGLALLWQLWSLFGEYRSGAVFSVRALTCLRRFASLLVLLALSSPLTQALMSVAISLDNPPGQRQLVISLSSNDYALVLGALVFVAIARVMTEAARVAQENEGFV